MNRHPGLPVPGLSRRTALGRVAAVGAALGLGSRIGRAAVQEATPTALASHPIVGTWYADFDPTNPGTLFVYTIFHADSTRTDVHPFAGAGIGAWEATGERTGRAINKYQNIATAPGDFVQGIVTVWSTFAVAEDGDSTTEDAVVELRGSDGAVVALFGFSGGTGSRRLVVEPPPPLGTPAAGTPAP